MAFTATVLLSEYPATSSGMSEQAAALQSEDNEPAGLTSPDSMDIKVEEQPEQQKPAGQNAAAEQVFMYLQVSSMRHCSVV